MIVDDYEISPYRQGWKLVTMVEGKDKAGNFKMQPRETYYPTLKQTLDSVIDNASGRCRTAQELRAMLTNTHALIEMILARNGLT